jgi:group I intron endonuclease
MENSMDIIYKLTSPSGKHYIGRTHDFSERMAGHKYKSKIDSQFPIHKAIRKHGWDNFTKEIICECKSEDSPTLESYYIEKYDSFKSGYNAVLDTEGGGDLWEGKRGTPEYEAWVEKMTLINGGSNNGMYGKTHKDSSIEKMKSKAKGRFSKQWYIERNGIEEGIRLYEERCLKLKNRNLKKGPDGKFVKKSENAERSRESDFPEPSFNPFENPAVNHYPWLDKKEILRELTREAQDMGLGYQQEATLLSAFPGTGKTHFYEASDKLVLDSDSSKFDKKYFPENYIQYIKDNTSRADVICISSHKEVRDSLTASGLHFKLVYPDRSLKEHYLSRYKQRGSPSEFIELVESNWDNWMDEMENQVGCEHIVLQENQFVSDVMRDHPVTTSQLSEDEKELARHSANAIKEKE